MIDQGFKAVFGDEQVAIQFLNAVLEGERKIQSIKYLNKEIQPENLKHYRDWRGAIKYAVNEGMEKGFDKGIKQGIEQGKAEGKAEGEALTSSRFVVNMKKAGLDEESIARIGNISVEEVKAILEKDIQ